jgi:hypothetical protein
VPEVYRSSIVKAAGKQLGSPFGRHPSHAEQQITKKLLHAIEVLIATLSDRWEILYREQGRGQRLQPGGSLLWSCDWGWLVIAISPAEPYHPGTAVADHRDIDEAVTRVLDVCR